MVYVGYGVNKVINAMSNSECFSLLEEKAIRRDWRQTKSFCNSISVIKSLETPLMLTEMLWLSYEPVVSSLLATSRMLQRDSNDKEY